MARADGAPGGRGRAQRRRILIVDDSAEQSAALAVHLRGRGYQVETARDGFKALPKLTEFAPDLLITDLRMPGMDGITLVKRAKEIDPDSVAVVMTGYDSIDGVARALREGAVHYVRKPIEIDALLQVVEPALEQRRARRQAMGSGLHATGIDRLDDMVGTSQVMRRVFSAVMQVASSRASVLITGESGTGKELVAAALHRHSPRRSGPFVRLHCAALAESLLESELFGHERGAFTGAAARREGRFHQAHGGTLFLDEIGEIPSSVQIKLLRFLQEREFERVGGNQTIKVDLRIVAATNRDLAAAVREGRFREDLFYRLNVVAIDVPPLRQREGDLPVVAGHFLRVHAARNHKQVTGFSDEAMERMQRYSWPGNVRELENAIERAVVVCRGELLGGEDLPPAVQAASMPDRAGAPQVPGSTLAAIERHAILATLEHTGGCTSRAAAILGISPRTIQYRLREYAGEAPRRPPGRAQTSPGSPVARTRTASSVEAPLDASVASTHIDAEPPASPTGEATDGSGRKT